MTSEQKEELRRLVLAFMAKRSACAFDAESVWQTVRREMRHTIEETQEALLFLFSARLLNEVPNKLGATRFYQANHEGVLAFERGD